MRPPLPGSRKQTLRGRIRSTIVATAIASATLMSIVAYLITRATRNERPSAGTEEALAPLAIALIVTTLVIAAVAALVSRRLAGGAVKSLAELSIAAQQMADRVDPGEHGTPTSDELETLASSFDRMGSGLQQRLLREQRFVATVSHELRTPLTALKTAADVLASKRGELQPAAAEAADLVVDRSRHMARLVIELMELRELDAGKASIRWEPVDLAALVVALLARRDRDPAVKGASVVTFSDKARLDRILGNLVDNAYEHADGRGVEVSIEKSRQEVIVTVSDRGPGIPPEDIPHLFESFFKTGRSRARKRGGIGLGLPIAYENARVLGGRISVESDVGRGTAFAVHLPIHNTPPQSEAISLTDSQLGSRSKASPP